MSNSKYRKELFFGNPIELGCGLIIKQPIMEDIENSVGYDYYHSILQSLTRYNYEFQFDFEDAGIDYTTYDTCSLFFLLAFQDINELAMKLDMDKSDENTKAFKDAFNKLKKCIELIFEGQIKIYNNALEITYLDKKLIYDMSSADEVKAVLSKMFYFTKPEKRRPANEAAKKIIKRQIQKQRKASHDQYDMYSLMSSLYWSQNYGDSRNNFLNLTPHQIYEGYFTIEKINNFHYTLNGVYSGTIKQENISFDKINWINKIK